MAELSTPLAHHDDIQHPEPTPDVGEDYYSSSESVRFMCLDRLQPLTPIDQPRTLPLRPLSSTRKT